MKKESKSSISDAIKDAMLLDNKRDINIIERSFWLNLVRRGANNGTQSWFGRIFGHWARTVSFVFLSVGVCLSATILVYSVIFFLKDIIFFEQKPIVNQSGAIIPQRSCSREVVLFYFDTSEMWVDTGIQLREGDQIRISHSGGFHGDILGLDNAARFNHRPIYHYYPKNISKDDANIQYAIYHEDPADAIKNKKYPAKEIEERRPRFGSIIWQVNNENTKGPAFDPQERIYQINPSKDSRQYITIKHNGDLFLSVNDVYITDAVKNSDYIWMTEKLKQNLEAGEVDRTFWFDDNVGSMLICIDIRRKLETASALADWYRQTEEQITDCLDEGGNRYEKMCRIFGIIFMSFFTLLWATLRLFGLVFSFVALGLAIIIAAGTALLYGKAFIKWSARRISRGGLCRSTAGTIVNFTNRTIAVPLRRFLKRCYNLYIKMDEGK